MEFLAPSGSLGVPGAETIVTHIGLDKEGYDGLRGRALGRDINVAELANTMTIRLCQGSHQIIDTVEEAEKKYDKVPGLVRTSRRTLSALGFSLPLFRFALPPA